MSIQYDSVPPATSYTSWRAISLRAGQELVVQVIGPIVGVWCHWSGRTTPCLGEACDGCTAGAQRRWVGYLPVSMSDQPRLILLSASTARDAAQAIQPGHSIRISRSTARGPVLIRAIAAPRAGAELPAVDCTPALLRLWGLPTASPAKPTAKPSAKPSAKKPTSPATAARPQDGSDQAELWDEVR